MDEVTFESLLAHEKSRVIFRAIWGSHAYGTNLATSDRDTVGVFVMGKQHYLTAQTPIQQCSDARNDHRFYTLKNFLELVSHANPNLLDALFVPDDCVLLTTPYWEMLCAKRHLFVSKLASKSYGEYALSQIKKAKGCNKRVNHPQPVEPPTAEDFCKFIPLQTSDANFSKAIDLADAGISLAHCHAAAVSGVANLFRLYDYGVGARGVFRNGTLVCESIPLADETRRLIGFLSFNKDAFEHAKRQHKHYWTWRQNRNDARWQNQEKALLDYDAKNMMHTFRLLYSGLNIMKKGEPLVRFSGEKLAKLMSIREGKWSYEALIEQAEALFAELVASRERSVLPEEVNTADVKTLLLEITEAWEQANA